ncbi:MAG TPA: GNAT family N-acetyltransferase [Vicinamibacteria bacterium]|nr:GNAT family N-acetyltransferase [Vicinamibacteria bacterium]
MTPLRTATAADAGAVAALINAAFKVERFFIEGDRTNEDEVQAYMAKGTFLLAEQDGAPVDCVYVEERGDRGYFGLLAVHPARHGKGLGRSLIQAAEERFRRAGMPRGRHPGRRPARRAGPLLPPSRVRGDGNRALPRRGSRDAALPFHPHIHAVDA